MFSRIAAVTLLLLLWVSHRLASADGRLRVHPSNPRYFTDDSGRAIFLAGHQWFNDLQETAWDHSRHVDWDDYLDFMRERGMNYLRSWIIWSTGKPHDDIPSPLMPFARTGPGVAVDGGPKFDLKRFDDDFFARLATRVSAAEKRGIYVSLMLFEPYGFLSARGGRKEDHWTGNLFRAPNNIQGLDVDIDQRGHGMNFFYSDDSQVRAIQRRYVQKMVETVAGCDNVFFEIANELHAPDWQLDILKTIREAEATLPRRHLIYLSPGGRDRAGRWSPLPKAFFAESTADVLAVTRSWDKSYFGNPPVENFNRPVFMDMDHVAAELNEGNNDWNNNPLAPWKLLTRGYHVCLYDSDYWKPGERKEVWDATRRSCGAAVEMAGRIDLASMQPQPELASTEYCLAKRGIEYIVLQPRDGNVTVRGLDRGSLYDVEWFGLTSPQAMSRTTQQATAESAALHSPAAGVVLHLKRQAPEPGKN